MMIRLARERLGCACPLEVSCMTRFTLTGVFDLATCWLDSLPYLLSNEDITSHLERVAGVLTEGGLYLVDIGFSHWADPMWHVRPEDWRPDSYGGWRAQRRQLEVYHDGWDGPPCDGFAHVSTEYLHFRATDLASGSVVERTHTAWKRALHPQEFAALVLASRVFEVVEFFAGSFALDQTLQATDGRGRGLVLLRKRG
jgi:hypothetical protein